MGTRRPGRPQYDLIRQEKAPSPAADEYHKSLFYLLIRVPDDAILVTALKGGALDSLPAWAQDWR